MGLWGVVKFFLFRAVEISVILTILVFIPNIPPYADFSKPFKVIAPKLEGKLSLNGRLNDVEIWHKGDLLGPEAFADYKGELYASIHSGDVVKLTGNHITPIIKFGKPCKGFFEEKICGRPLGLKFDSRGYLYVADAYYGIFKVNVLTGNKERLVSMDVEIAGKKPKLPNALAIASNGDIYWTDSSTQFILQDGIFDMLSDGNGRLIHYNAKTGRNVVLLKDLHFANGVHLSENEDFVLVAETGLNRILRYYLRGSKTGQHDVFIDKLPGHPDNINTDGQGGFLIPLVVAIDADHPSFLLTVGPFPRLRKLVARLIMLPEIGFEFMNRMYPNEFCQRATHFIGHFTSVSALHTSKRVTILHVSKTGEILDVVHSTNGKISSISEAYIFRDKLYLGSPHNDYIARVPLEQIGLGHLKQKIAPKTERTVTQQSTSTTTTPRPITTPKPTAATARPTTEKSTAASKPVTAAPKPTVTTTKPTTTTTPRPTTVSTSKPVTTTPKPAVTTTPKPAVTTTPKPTTTTTSKPAVTTTPKPAVTTTPKPAPVTTPKPATTTTSKPAVTTTKPTTTTTSKPATTTTPATPKPATTTTPKPAAATKPTTSVPPKSDTPSTSTATKPTLTATSKPIVDNPNTN